MDKKSKVFLFDMDGTLSPSRKKVVHEIGIAFRSLSKFGTIGIVSGSDYDFIDEQMSEAWHYFPCDSVVILPCNGTKRYQWRKEGVNSRFVLTDASFMKQEIGSSSYRKIIQYIVSEQSKFCYMDEDVTNSLTGNFITYRGSMINWSPVGRNGSGEDRESFVDFDKKTGYRKKVLSGLHEFLRDNSISVKASLGGDTSFDLFPLGWDKTFCLKYFDSNSNFYFFGDRCYPGGNDFEIYEKIKQIGSAYSVSGPQQTYQILTQLIKDFENESMDR